MRNQVIHGLFNDTYEDGIKGVSKNNFDMAFKQGMKLSDILQRKGEIE